MFKIYAIVVVVVSLFINTFAHAQSNGLDFTRIETRSTPNCEMGSDTWFFNEETEFWDHSTTAIDATIYAQVMPGSWIGQVGATVTIKCEDEPFFGDVSILVRSYAQKYVYPYNEVNKTNIYTKKDILCIPGETPVLAQTGYVGGQVTFNVGFYYTSLGMSYVWDMASQGSVREMYATIELVETESVEEVTNPETGEVTEETVIHPIPSGYLRIDQMRVKSFDGGSYCYAH